MKIVNLLILAFTIMTLSACGGDEPINYAQAQPEEVIEGFYNSIYKDRNLEQAKQLSSERMADLINHYGAVSAVQRYVLGRYFETVEIEVETNSFTDYLNNSEDLRVTVIFHGYHNGERAKDSRDVVLIKRDDAWVVDKILDTRYRP
ncbi:hypothetical protein U0358_06290 [Idiomarina sp. PL1-037]|uniref:hypothetical protein n=1 Tax=Idiomarina sp. PL1-037 TaxID=3095365 RepID=UPI002ACC0BD4|nr:hypothetical protein [Idiomarina sp. PL1-037]WQC54158.1 hypothetical protein U0358_06290 [Idiomarina sp. PL1-037]